MSEPSNPIVANVCPWDAPQYVATIEVNDCSSAMKDYVHLVFVPVRGAGSLLVSIEGEDADLLIAALIAWRQERGR